VVGSAIEDKELQIFLRHITLPDLEKQPPQTQRKKVIVLSGPTGVGKTNLSLLIARTIGGEIISADSMQIYQGMDIGTDKVSIEQRDAIPHHLIDIRNLSDSFNVVDFWQEATRSIEEIHSRGAVPIVVGGTGFYIHALLYGPPNGPPSVPEVRLKFEDAMKEQGARALFEQLMQLDPEYAHTITQNDKHKIIRALEIISLTNKKVSQFSKQNSIDTQKYNFRCWFLYMPKEILYRMIESRCDEMIAKGFLNEVKALEKLGLRNNSSASQAIGYRQCLEFLSSPQSQDDWEHFVLSFKQASRRYAKRQFTWFRKEPLFRWLNREDVSFERAAEIILQDFELSF
jgi:tRNA dimethylallyltransferase